MLLTSGTGRGGGEAQMGAKELDSGGKGGGPETDSSQSDWFERGRRLFAGPCDFVLGAADMSGLPPPDRVEVAFAGRSNVGKSSLINALTGRKSLARTSNTPGRTRELNFFNLGTELRLVDLPGYGYARAPKSRVDQWTALVSEFLRGRPCLRRVYLLVDARRGLMPGDLAVMDLLDGAALSYQILLTKSDKLKAGELERLIARLEARARRHPACHPRIHATSSHKRAGLEQVRAEIAALAEGGP